MSSSSHAAARGRSPSKVASQSLFQVQKRSFTLNGKETSIALEKAFWSVIELVAKQKDKTWRQIIIMLARAKPEDVDTLASCVRVWCVTTLHKTLIQVLSTTKET